MEKLYGVTAAITTPLKTNGSLNTAALADLTDRLINRGVNCLYPCGTTGEMLKLSLPERKVVAETVVAVAKGRVPVFVHVGAGNGVDTLELASHAYKVGANGVGIVSPQFFCCNPCEIFSYYNEIAARLPEDFPIYLYAIPQCAANDILPETAAALYKKHKNIVGMKYSFTDFNRTTEYLDIAEEFSVLHGCDRLFSSLLILGCDGTVSGISGVVPEPFVEVYRAYIDKDYVKVQYWQKACRRICDILKCGTSIAYLKSGLEFRGIQGGSVRRPQLDLEKVELACLKTQLAEFLEVYGLSQRL